MIVGPWVNQPEEYEGYNGFVGWAGVTRLRSGRWLLAFTSGSWHMTPPWTDEIARNPLCRQYMYRYKTVAGTQGWIELPAPRGGRAHVMHSDDQGATWSKPQTLVDTEWDDRSPTILELDNGTLLCTFFQVWLAETRPGILYNAKYMLSHDQGETWTEPMNPGGHTVFGAFSNGPAIQLSSGAIVWVVTRTLEDGAAAGHNDVCAVFGSAWLARTPITWPTSPIRPIRWR